MPPSVESNACTPTTAPTTLACWRSTANLGSFRESRSSFSRRHCDRRPERSRTPGDNVSGMSAITQAEEANLQLDTQGFAIVVEGLRKRYGNLVAVDGISFRVKEREIFGLLGPNGAGKTTTVEILEGLRQADAGRAVVAGIDVFKAPQKVKSRIGVQLQASAFFDYLTLAELIDMFAALYERPIDAGALLRRVGLEEKATSRVKTLSGGQKPRFSIATALVNEPRVLFLDEPTTGLDPQARRNLWELAQAIRQDGRTIVLTTHYMDEAETLCDRVAVMDRGKIIAMDTPATLVGNLLAKGDRDVVVVLPASLGQGPVALPAFYNAGKPQESSAALAIMSRFVDEASFQYAHIQPSFTLNAQPVNSRNLSYIDFLVPGVIAMSIMQTGLFSVAFSFVAYKQQGILRRLMATPMRVPDFLMSRIVTYLVMAVVQMAILIVLGLLLYHLHFIGNIAYLIIVGFIPAAIFMAVRFTISGFARVARAGAARATLISVG